MFLSHAQDTEGVNGTVKLLLAYLNSSNIKNRKARILEFPLHY